MATMRTIFIVISVIFAAISYLGYKFGPQPSDGLVYYMETSSVKWQRIVEDTLEADSFPNCSTLFVIIHGYSESSSRSWIPKLSSALAQWSPNACIIIVDHWNYLSFSRVYMTENIQIIAAELATFLQNISLTCGISFSSMHVIAFSIAGQIVGALPAYLKENEILGRITGIDNSPTWWPTTDRNRFLDSSDAELVVSLRTSRFGVSNADFDVDFYFNSFDGTQPSCDKWWWPDFVGQICSHYRALDVLIEMIESESNIKSGCRCKGTLIEEECDSKDQNSFGFNINPQNKGNFCIRTEDHPPYLKRL